VLTVLEEFPTGTPPTMPTDSPTCSRLSVRRRLTHGATPPCMPQLFVTFHLRLPFPLEWRGGSCSHSHLSRRAGVEAPAYAFSTAHKCSPRASCLYNSCAPALWWLLSPLTSQVMGWQACILPPGRPLHYHWLSTLRLTRSPYLRCDLGPSTPQGWCEAGMPVMLAPAHLFTRCASCCLPSPASSTLWLFLHSALLAPICLALHASLHACALRLLWRNVGVGAGWGGGTSSGGSCPPSTTWQAYHHNSWRRGNSLYAFPKAWRGTHCPYLRQQRRGEAASYASMTP